MLTRIETYYNSQIGLEGRTELLDKTSWLAHLEWSRLQKLASFMDLYDLPLGTTVVSEGDRQPHLILIVKGQVRVVKKSKDGTEAELAKLGRGHSLGEMSLVEESATSATVVTTNPTQILAMSQANLKQLSIDDPYVAFFLAMNIARLLSVKLRRTSSLLVD